MQLWKNLKSPCFLSKLKVSGITEDFLETWNPKQVGILVYLNLVPNSTVTELQKNLDEWAYD